MHWYLDARTNRLVPGPFTSASEPTATPPDVSPLDERTIAAYHAWRRAHDEGYAYDEIFDFVDGTLSRGELLTLMDAATGYVNDMPENRPTEP